MLSLPFSCILPFLELPCATPLTSRLEDVSCRGRVVDDGFLPSSMGGNGCERVAPVLRSCFRFLLSRSPPPSPMLVTLDARIRSPPPSRPAMPGGVEEDEGVSFPFVMSGEPNAYLNGSSSKLLHPLPIFMEIFMSSLISGGPLLPLLWWCECGVMSNRDPLRGG